MTCELQHPNDRRYFQIVFRFFLAGKKIRMKMFLLRENPRPLLRYLAATDGNLAPAHKKIIWNANNKNANWTSHILSAVLVALSLNVRCVSSSRAIFVTWGRCWKQTLCGCCKKAVGSNPTHWKIALEPLMWLANDALKIMFPIFGVYEHFKLLINYFTFIKLKSWRWLGQDLFK